MEEKKILTLAEIADFSLQQKKLGKTVALCHGTFDLLHIGHIKHLQRAAQEADCLLVTITSDGFVNKGPDRPVFSQLLRAENIAALACVANVAINDAETSVNVLELIKPDVYVKGSDYCDQEDITGNIQRERDAVENCEGRIFFTDELTSSSTRLLNDYFEVFSPKVIDYLAQVKQRYTSEQVIEQLQGVQGSNVLVVGEAIIDEYHYTSPLGQTGKGNVLSVKYEDNECFAGGAIAVANHIAEFVSQVTLLSVLGAKDSREEFIRDNLAKQVNPEFFIAHDRQTIVKRRYVDRDISKLFEVYFYSDEDLPEDLGQDVVDWLDQSLEQFDVVIVADFGNGFISDRMVNVLSKKANYLAVNAQINSGNRGYHLITRYPRADFISLNEPELRMATHDRTSDLSQLAQQIANQLNAENIAVTRGTHGALLLESNREQYCIPALSSKVVDRIGAGDAFLALTGLCLANKMSAEVALLIGSAAAALDVQIVCNREPIRASVLYKYLISLLK